MIPVTCPPWEYESVPQYRDILKPRIAEILLRLRRGRMDALTTAGDSRPVHKHMFSELVPSGFGYYAGHYRGEDLACLRWREVGIPGDPRVGVFSARVQYEMEELKQTILTGVAALDAAEEIPSARVPPEHKLLYDVIFASRVLVELLTIHPYLNGNGHAARFVLWAILGRYGHWPQRFPIEPRPPNPPYYRLIADYRSGNHEALERFVLKSLIAN